MAAKLPKAIADMQLTAVRTLTSILSAPGLSASVAGSVATLTWTPPTPTGQSAIAGYRLYKGASAGATNTLVGTFSTLSTTDTLSATTFYRVEAFDQYQTGVSSGSLSCTPVATNSVILFNPSHGLELDPGSGGGGIAGWTGKSDGTGTTGRIKSAAQQGFKFVVVIQTLAKLEGPTLGDYSKAFTTFDAIDFCCAANGIQWGLIWQDRNFSASTYSGAPAPSTAGLPAYWPSTEFYTPPSGTNPGGLGGMAFNHHAYATGRYLALGTAMYARYGASGRFLHFRGPESAVAGAWISASGSGYSNAAYFTQINNLYAALRTAMPTVCLSHSMNYGGDPIMQTTFAAFSAADTGGLGPDQSIEAFSSNRVHTGNIGGHDYRNEIVCIAEMQFATLTRENTIGQTPQDIYNNAMTGSLAGGGSTKPNYWIIFDVNPTDGRFGVSDWVAAMPSMPVNTQIPSSYGLPVPQNVILVQQAGTNNGSSPVSNSQKIQWDAVSGAATYKVYRNGVLRATVSAPTTSYTDSTATNSNILTYDAPATAYYYQVSAVNGSTEGPQSTQYEVYEYRNGASTCGNSIFNYGTTFSWSDTAGVPFWGTNCFSATWPGTGGAQVYSNSPLSNVYGLTVGAFNYLIIEAVQPSTTNHFEVSLHSRVTNPPGDVFSRYTLPTANYIVGGGPIVPNTKQTYKFPLAALGLGITDFIGSISGTTLTVTSVTSTGVQNTDYPGIDRGAQLIGVGGSVSAGTFINDLGTGTGGVGTYQIDAPHSQTTGSFAMRTIRDSAYKWDWHTITGGDSGKVLMNNMRFSRL